MARPDAVGVVLAAGTGSRIGADANKAYLPLAGRSMVTWSLDAIARVREIARTVLVVRHGERQQAERTLERELPAATVELVEGGDSRHASEFNVLRYLAADIESGAIDVVLIHDGARPLAGPAMMRAAVSVAREFGGAVPALAAHDIVRVDPTGAISPRPEGPIVRVQTPQAFRALPLLRAYRAAERQGFEGTDTSACIERFTDVDVRTFQGDERNLKVTYPRDVLLAERLLIRLSHDRSDALK
jgi:2-C-methyl-D-erythritol 4-phosphate cytidylyltransferase